MPYHLEVPVYVLWAPSRCLYDAFFLITKNEVANPLLRIPSIKNYTALQDLRWKPFRSSYLWLLHDPLFSMLLESLGLYCVYCIYLIFEGLFKNMDHTLICQNPLAHIRNKSNNLHWGRFCVSEWQNPSIKQLWLEHIKPQNHHYWLNKTRWTQQVIEEGKWHLPAI